ncbi:SDR family NAD(P)-dependent oxidoreductase [Gammaproteobacteria bacterium]|jgi:NADP-dependent 3-hydroxy acid dehydrogenase YdfG|nr:SDR family NAD(P)-dependent oxidoreductase [bacterium]MDA7797004.1 SDR family NAD(P)-dependent oxidoreductase [Gammaproteobacteria bacterium]MDA7699357.1 SDR family NAD(P)-dependent oxidoreductase [bacterium]MDA9049088.1 SDR family NAD(P)-dependent oxidoreductase [Gammaproteobacteria bacterium]MDA9974020.1 SDR family NAD(P)-dependent oxidoreductase [Gammaproteobacteria bacterium]|tara:strand:- start:1852 stop:2616 length:765 start_codon:yes stop_codon:yes gene_type:complete
MKPVCLVLGAGAGIGGTVAAKFASEGFHACLCRRSDQDGLDQMVSQIEERGGSASGYLIDAIEENVLEDLVATIEKDVGPIEVLIYNLGAQSGMKLLHETSLKEFEWGWRMADLGLFRIAKSLMPIMEARGSGTFLVTSATAAMRGNKNQHSHAAAMGGRRMLCQTLNAEFSAKGIHVAHVVVDGMVDAPDTLGKMLGEEMFQQLRESRGMEHDGLILPEKIAETYYHLAQQHRSAWTHEIDLRPFSDVAWWNS